MLRAKLVAKGIDAYTVELPEKDPCAFFLRHPPEAFEAALKRANPKTLERSVHVRKRGETSYEPTEHGFRVLFGARRYDVKGIARSGTQLKVTVKASPAPPGTALEGDQEKKSAPGWPAPFELTTLDLYSSRSRDYHAKVLARLFGETEALVREDLLRLVEKAEAWVVEARLRETTEKTPTMTDAERAEALAFLEDPRIEDQVVRDLAAMGICGEERKQAARLPGRDEPEARRAPLDGDPVALGGGEVDPPGRGAGADPAPRTWPKYTRITDQALFYREGGSFKHKVLALEEAEGMGGAVYSLRALQSAGEVRILSTGKDPATGSLTSRETTVEGPVSVFMTTTRPSTEVDGELASRNLFTTVDESRERTEDILSRQRERWTLEGRRQGLGRKAIERRHRNAQRLLEAGPWS